VAIVHRQRTPLSQRGASLTLPPQCRLCPHHSRPILGDGPEPCRILLLGEGPAFHEVRKGYPFCGKSGQELDHQYLPMAGLCRPDVRVSNVMKCALPGFRNPEVDEAIACAAHWIPDELKRCQPGILVTVGAVATHALFPDCDLNLEHGTPRWASIFGWSGIHVPVYHPAAGLHEESFMLPLQADFHALGMIQRGEFVMPIDEHPIAVYRCIDSISELDHVLAPWKAQGRAAEGALDTEVVQLKPRTPWCLSFSFQPGTGYVILAERRELVQAFAKYVGVCRPLLNLHAALFDLDVTRDMGVVIDRFSDTMQAAYELGNLPQGLKALAYRLCGMHMQEFEDLVLPYSRDGVLAWLLDAGRELVQAVPAEPTNPKLPRRPTKKQLSGMPTELADEEMMRIEMDRILVVEEHQAQKEAYKSNPLVSGATKLRSLLLAMDKPATNPWKRWRGWEDSERDAVSRIVGDMPPASIVQVPLLHAVNYAGRDADATLRIAPILRRMMAQVGRGIA
jgi:uracil-DNA glycosylase family 4